MFNPADLPERLAVFPLPGARLLPRTRLPLNIFEPRYLAMLEDTLKTSHRLIGMIQPLGYSPKSEAPRLHSIGCAGRVVAFSETEDGRNMITLGGVSRFRIRNVERRFSPYFSAQVSWTEFERDLGKPETDTGFDRELFLSRLDSFFRETGMKSDWQSIRQADDELLINSLAMLVPFEVEEKQALLEAPTLSDRCQTLVTLMEFAMATGGGEGTLQ